MAMSDERNTANKELEMTIATQTFSRAIKVRRSNTGCYEFAGREQFFADVTSYRDLQFDWDVVEPLAGWGDWTHAVVVIFGDEEVYYFAR